MRTRGRAMNEREGLKGEAAIVPDAASRAWLAEGLLLSALAIVVTIVFGFTRLDIAAARVFYFRGAADPWPLAKELPWSVLYRAAPWITAALVGAGLVALLAGAVRRRADWRRHAAFLLLSVVVGPGMIVNAVFKDHWERPRPRDVVELGGPLHYRPAPLPGGDGGASFPCGHCSVGFLFGAGWWVWRRRRPALARAALATGVVAGFALGLGRMAAGGHFLSDVFWSAILALGVAHALYYYVLRIPRVEARELAATGGPGPPHRRQHWVAIVAALGGVAVLAALFVTPHGAQLAATLETSSLPAPPRIFSVEARTANVHIVVVDAPAGQISIDGELHGFGLPTSRLDAQLDFEPQPLPTLHYRIHQYGWFTDLDGSAAIRLPIGDLERIVVRVMHGNITVTDTTRAGAIAGGRVRLELETADGRVTEARRLTTP
jgi:lipid A 4'-phosphatase